MRFQYVVSKYPSWGTAEALSGKSGPVKSKVAVKLPMNETITIIAIAAVVLVIV